MENKEKISKRKKKYNIENKERISEYNKKQYINNKEKNIKRAKEYREENKEKLVSAKKIYVFEHKDEVKQQKKSWYEKNKEQILLSKKERYNKNKKAIIQWQMEYTKTNIQERIRHSLRVRLSHALRNNFKAGSAVRDLGCSIQELIIHLENKFLPGMSWANYGSWHIDHIMPLSKFDLTDREQFLQACCYTNLQPLWAEDNLKKGSSIPK